MPANRWLDTTQPQTLLIAVILLYINAAESLLFGGFANPISLVIIVGEVAAGYGISNEKKWGYGLGVVMAIIVLVFILLSNPFAGANLISLLFGVALVALLLHPQSREYQRIWFK
jgi:uncharacterized membrane protein HdeD (DUF308 family)